MWQVLMGLAVSVGVVTAALLGAGPWLAPHLFTRDAQLWPLMRSVAPQARHAHAPASSIVESPGLCACASSKRRRQCCACQASVAMISSDGRARVVVALGDVPHLPRHAIASLSDRT